MLIDCDLCAMRDLACDDCVVGLLLDTPRPARGTERGVGPPTILARPDEFDAVERSALEALAAGGLIPSLRLVCSSAGDTTNAEGDGRITERRSLAG